MTTIKQADRDAAADAVKAYREQKNNNWQQRIRDGNCDDGEMVQAFARHREAAEREALERAARVAGQAFLAWSMYPSLNGEWNEQDAIRALECGQLSSAIRALCPTPRPDDSEAGNGIS